jgi:hypothetical protein
MIIEMVFLAVFWLNGFPHKLGISQTLSPRTIVTRLSIDYNKQCRIEYGQYVQTHEKHDNAMTTRTIGALALRPTGNQQGGYYFYSLMSGQRLHRTHWTELPMPAKVTTLVHDLARRANANRGLTFTGSHGNDLDLLYPGDDDNDADSNYDPAHDDDNDDNSFTSSDDSDNTSADLSAAPNPAELAGVNEPVNITGVADPTPGVDIRTPGVAGETPGVTETPKLETPELKEYVNELKAELDAEIAGLDSDYSPENESDTEDDDLDDSFTPINNDKAAAANAHAARKQASADDAIPALHERDDGASDDEDEESDDRNLERPRPRLRRNRIPNYGHLKGREAMDPYRPSQDQMNSKEAVTNHMTSYKASS